MKSVFDEKKEKISMTTIRERSIDDIDEIHQDEEKNETSEFILKYM